MDIKKISKSGKKLSMVTCYDYSFARILNESDVDIILVGDSLANVLLGLSDIKQVSMDEMINHTASVRKGATDKIIIADLPYLACQKKNSRPITACRQFIKAGADAIKIEWFPGCEKTIGRLIKGGIPVMGHIGLTPQTADLLGGYRVQGKNKESKDNLKKQAKKLEELGVFSLVLECVKKEAAKEITKSLSIPTIGIGSGKHCSGQVLVLYDLLGLYPGKMKFVRVFSDLSGPVKKAVNSFHRQVREGSFPSDEESY